MAEEIKQQAPNIRQRNRAPREAERRRVGGLGWIITAAFAWMMLNSLWIVTRPARGTNHVDLPQPYPNAPSNTFAQIIQELKLDLVRETEAEAQYREILEAVEEQPMTEVQLNINSNFSQETNSQVSNRLRHMLDDFDKHLRVAEQCLSNATPELKELYYYALKHYELTLEKYHEMTVTVNIDSMVHQEYGSGDISTPLSQIYRGISYLLIKIHGAPQILDDMPEEQVDLLQKIKKRPDFKMYAMKEVVKLLRQDGIRIEQQEENNLQLLYTLAKDRSPDCVKLLLEVGADPQRPIELPHARLQEIEQDRQLVRMGA